MRPQILSFLLVAIMLLSACGGISDSTSESNAPSIMSDSYRSVEENGPLDEYINESYADDPDNGEESNPDLWSTRADSFYEEVQDEDTSVTTLIPGDEGEYVLHTINGDPSIYMDENMRPIGFYHEF